MFRDSLFRCEHWMSFLDDRGLADKNLLRRFEIGAIPRRAEFGGYAGRLCFPVRNVYGEFESIQARARGKQLPRYLHPKGWAKSKSLYGLNVARRRILSQNRVVVVEGPTDVLAVHLAGDAAVGLLGANLSAWHLGLIVRYTRNIVFMADGDRAGENAIEHAKQVATPLGVKLQLRILASGDPSSILQNHGKKVLREIIEGG